MASKKAQPKPASRPHPRAFEPEQSGLRVRPGQPPTVSGRWLLVALSLTVVAAAICGWGALCLLFWQGSWQLLYHPKSAVTRTPASAGLAFEPIGFAVNDAGQPRLEGWWIPAAPNARFSRYTVVYLHGSNGNLGDTVPALARLHSVGVNVFAFDYRGYGQSRFVHPSEARWRQDAGWALQYLTGTRQMSLRTIVLDGEGLGANLALEIAAAHPELAGVVLESPLRAPMNAVFGDPRARMIPAHLLVRDRFALDSPAASLRIPSLWFLSTSGQSETGHSGEQPEAFRKVSAAKTLVWLPPSTAANKTYTDAFSRWLEDAVR